MNKKTSFIFSKKVFKFFNRIESLRQELNYRITEVRKKRFQDLLWKYNFWSNFVFLEIDNEIMLKKLKTINYDSNLIEKHEISFIERIKKEKKNTLEFNGITYKYKPLVDNQMSNQNGIYCFRIDSELPKFQEICENISWKLKAKESIVITSTPYRGTSFFYNQYVNLTRERVFETLKLPQSVTIDKEYKQEMLSNWYTPVPTMKYTPLF